MLCLLQNEHRHIKTVHKNIKLYLESHSTLKVKAKYAPATVF